MPSEENPARKQLSGGDHSLRRASGNNGKAPKPYRPDGSPDGSPEGPLGGGYFASSAPPNRLPAPDVPKQKAVAITL